MQNFYKITNAQWWFMEQTPLKFVKLVQVKSFSFLLLLNYVLIKRIVGHNFWLRIVKRLPPLIWYEYFWINETGIEFFQVLTLSLALIFKATTVFECDNLSDLVFGTRVESWEVGTLKKRVDKRKCPQYKELIFIKETPLHTYLWRSLG